MPNSLAYLMLLVWPLIAAGLFRRLPVERALIWSILGAYLILPPIANFDVPLVPAMDKVSIPNLAAYLMCVAMVGQRVPMLPEAAIGRLLMILFVLSPVLTVVTNVDPVFFVVGGLPGLRIQDSVTAVISQAITVLPYFLARRFLATEAAQRELLFALVVAGVVYSFPMLLEVRLSPQLNTWIYGFFQHDFIQMMRAGGFRPIVFLPHGLWIAFFSLMTVIAAVALSRTAEPKGRTPYLLAAGYLGVVLVLCKSVASLVYCISLAPFLVFVGSKTQLRIAAVLALIAVLYPLLRGAELVPIDAMMAQAERVSADRAQSLWFRFENENVLLRHASERPLFGWGPWGRNHIYDLYSGKMLTVTDGRWVIVIGTFGWFGYFAEFGLLALPLLLLVRRVHKKPAAEVSPYIGPLALILAINMIDMLPNATLIPFTWLLAGAMLGYGERLKAGAVAGTERLVADRNLAQGAPADSARQRTIL